MMLCPKCGEPMEFEDHVDTDAGRNAASLWMCPKCGASAYAGFEGEADRWQAEAASREAQAKSEDRWDVMNKMAMDIANQSANNILMTDVYGHWHVLEYVGNMTDMADPINPRKRLYRLYQSRVVTQLIVADNESHAHYLAADHIPQVKTTLPRYGLGDELVGCLFDLYLSQPGRTVSLAGKLAFSTEAMELLADERYVARDGQKLPMFSAKGYEVIEQFQEDIESLFVDQIRVDGQIIRIYEDRGYFAASRANQRICPFAVGVEHFIDVLAEYLSRDWSAGERDYVDQVRSEMYGLLVRINRKKENS